jgi:hypothetical protein
MEEILEKLLQSEILSTDTKQELTEAWQDAVKAKMSELRESAMLEVRAELADQWVKERDVLIEKLDVFVTEQIENEFNELRSDIESFRDLEAEYAGKLVLEKQAIAESMTDELDQLIDKIDSFFEVRLSEELEELKEDLELAKQNDFGRRIFEAFSTEFTKSYVDENSIQSKLTVTESKLEDLKQCLAESEKANEKLLREAKMEELLKPLSGGKREQMQFVLQNVETRKLDEAYSHFIGRVLKEEAKDTKLVETKIVETKVITGEEKEEAAKEVQAEKTLTESKLSSTSLETLRRLAGITG